MVRPLVTIYLDIDGVLNTIGGPHHQELDPALVANLNYLLRRVGPDRVQIVINSGWNTKPLSVIRDHLVEAGFAFPGRMVGQTNSARGGGEPIRQWILDNDLVGEPYLIIDDGSNYDEMWCRLIWCDAHKGLTAQRSRDAADQVWRSVREEAERRYAVKHLVAHCQWLAMSTPWLSREARDKAIADNLDKVRHCLMVEDFLLAALLKRPDAAPE